jgi:hypothetical protein
MQSSPIGKIKKIGSVEIPDLTSILEIRDEPVFDGYRKGGCLPRHHVKADLKKIIRWIILGVPQWRGRSPQERYEKR